MRPRGWPGQPECGRRGVRSGRLSGAMICRALLVYRALLRGQLAGEALPAAPLLLHAAISGALMLLVRGELEPFPYALVALALSGALVALSLLGELGGLLRSDPAREWALALPLRALDLQIARVLLAATLVLVLSLGALLPAALLAPANTSLVERVLLLGGGLGQALFLAGALLAVQSALGERAEALLILFQTLLLVAIVVGSTLLPSLVQVLVPMQESGELSAPLLAWLPPTWFALPVGSPPAALPGPWLTALLTLGSLALLALLPPAAEPRARWRRTPLGFVLEPVRALFERVWVAPAERGSFRLVWEALPRERDFVLRTYPMIGIPLAFLLVGLGKKSGAQFEGLLAVLLFSPAIYLPILLAHVPATATPEARWMLDLAPLPRSALDAGARKAAALRFVLPLILLLGVLAGVLAGPHFALRLTPIALAGTVLLLRGLYPLFALDLPLSVPAQSIDVREKFTGVLFPLVFVVPIVAALVQHGLTTIGPALAVALALFAAEGLLELRDRRRYGRTIGSALPAK